MIGVSKIFQLLICLLLAGIVHAQETCTEKLYHANLLYEKGQLKEAIEIAKSCADGNTTKNEKWLAYRLLSMVYLAGNQSYDARKAAEKMLELNPTYKPSSIKDPVELVRLIKSIKVIPRFSIGLAGTVGSNFTFVQITGTYNGADYQKKYTAQSSWQLGVITGYHINELISLHSGLTASSRAYNIDYSVPGWDISISENLSYLGVPLFARFNSQYWKKIRAFADAGAYAGRLLRATSDFSRTNTITNTTESTIGLSSENRRANWEYGMFYGAGVMYKLGSLNLAVDVRYYLSYANITKTTNRYQHDNLFHNYYFFDDDLRLDNLAISFSLIYDVNYKVIKSR